MRKIFSEPVITRMYEDGNFKCKFEVIKEILNELEDCDGFISKLDIRNKALKDYLLSQGIIFDAGRGVGVKDDEKRMELLNWFCEYEATLF